MVAEGPGTVRGSLMFTGYWTASSGEFRPEPSNVDSDPVGFRRGQVFSCPPDKVLAEWFAESHPHAVVVKTHGEARALAWREMTDAERGDAAESQRRILADPDYGPVVRVDGRVIYTGSARTFRERALEWLDRG